MDEVERLARRSRQGKTVESRMATITTAITQLTDEGPIYRGRKATELATRWGYEEVAEWLWSPEETADLDDGAARIWEPCPLGRPPAIGLADRMRWAVVMAGARDPLRADLRPDAIRRAGRRVAASMVAMVSPSAMPTRGTPTRHADAQANARAEAAPLVLEGDHQGTTRSNSLAGRLTLSLTRRATPSPALVRAVNAAMVLMADHELATSTLAVRVAASTRSDVYDALLAGLATLAGPLHGGASQLAHAMLVAAERDGPEQALDDTLRWQGVLPGFGHSVYKQGDARFTVLLALFEEIARPSEVALVHSVISLAADHAIPLPNVDLGLAAIAWSAGLPPDTGRTLFTVARVAGWVAHYLEELGERPLRYRARAVYASTRSNTTALPPGRSSSGTQAPAAAAGRTLRP